MGGKPSKGEGFGKPMVGNTVVDPNVGPPTNPGKEKRGGEGSNKPSAFFISSGGPSAAWTYYMGDFGYCNQDVGEPWCNCSSPKCANMVDKTRKDRTWGSSIFRKKSPGRSAIARRVSRLGETEVIPYDRSSSSSSVSGLNRTESSTHTHTPRNESSYRPDSRSGECHNWRK